MRLLGSAHPSNDRRGSQIHYGDTEIFVQYIGESAVRTEHDGLTRLIESGDLANGAARGGIDDGERIVDFVPGVQALLIRTQRRAVRILPDRHARDDLVGMQIDDGDRIIGAISGIKSGATCSDAQGANAFEAGDLRYRLEGRDINDADLVAEKIGHEQLSAAGLSLIPWPGCAK